MRFRRMRALGLILLPVLAVDTPAPAASVSIGTFQVDVSPPAGAPLGHGNYPPNVRVVDPLTARGIVLVMDDGPVVLCAVDWIGIGNGGYQAWREALAEAAGTRADRVAVHAVHQHDTPGCDFSAEELLAAHGHPGTMFDVDFAREAIGRVAAAVREARANARPITHVGIGQAEVERIASNRRILGPDGRVQHFRASAAKDPDIVAAPEGLIDPVLRIVSLWDESEPIASLMFYACHPQSAYRRGAVSADFVGLARAIRELTLPAVAQIYFTGAAGNVAAGKYNDGAIHRRLELAERLAVAMRRAWDATEKFPLTSDNVDWKVQPVRLPLREDWTSQPFEKTLADPGAGHAGRVRAARALTWIQRCERGETIDLTCLELGPARILALPGESFVEYQLAAQRLAPERFVCVAAYGDYGPGYIGTADAYAQGGYEITASRVAPTVEGVLMAGLRELLIAPSPADP